MSRLCTKLKLPSSPPDPARISPDILALHNTISARYVGAASLIAMKTPQEGFQKQGELLEGIREGYKGKVDRVYRMSKDQQAVFQAGLQNYSNFGGHGSGNNDFTSINTKQIPGKTLLKQVSIARDTEEIVSDPDCHPHCQIVCVWQEGADALIEQYKKLVSKLPKADHLEVMVVTKRELMKKFKTTERAIESTTDQINGVCRNIAQLMMGTVVYFYIDECWITVPRQFSAHLTAVSLECSVSRYILLPGKPQ